MKYSIALLSLVFLISCGKDDAALTEAPQAPAPEIVKEEPATPPATTPEGTTVTTTEEMPPAPPEAVTTPKPTNERWGIKFFADKNCQVEEDGEVLLFQFGKGKTLTLHEDGLMTAHDKAGKEWLHVPNVKEIIVLRENVGFLDANGLFRYVWVGQHSLIEFYNAKKLIVDEEGFLVFGQTDKASFLSAYRWDSASIVNTFMNPASYELLADKVVVTDAKNKPYEYKRTKSPLDKPKKK